MRLAQPTTLLSCSPKLTCCLWSCVVQEEVPPRPDRQHRGDFPIHVKSIPLCHLHTVRRQAWLSLFAYEGTQA